MKTIELINELNTEIEKYNDTLGDNKKIDWHDVLGKFDKDSDREELICSIVCVMRARLQFKKRTI